MKPKTCIICKRRRVKQQEWKTKEEKEICLTCRSFKNAVGKVLSEIKEVADKNHIPINIIIKYED